MVQTFNSFAGYLLLATPGISDPRFSKKVIYLHQHNEEGALGFVINQQAEEVNLAEILNGLKLKVPDKIPDRPVYIGGPVDTGRGFVLHDDSYKSNSTDFSANGQIGITTTLDILEALCQPQPIDNALILLGYAGWHAGQLEQEMQDNAWLVCELNLDLVFSITAAQKYQAGFALMGISPGTLSLDSGTA